jgi:hypothetical protein
LQKRLFDMLHYVPSETVNVTVGKSSAQDISTL